MKKRLICLLLSALLLSSCGGGAPSVQPGDAGSGPDEIELSLWTFPVGNWGDPTALSNLLTSFHKQYPNIHISVEYLTYDTGDAAIAQAVEDGTAPDLVFEGPERIVANWGEKGWMADLSDLWESDQASQIYDNIRTACRYRDGTYYEFPICMSAHCMVINYGMFQAADALQYIDEETHTWTTEGFVNAVQALTAHGLDRAGVLYCKNQSGDQGTRALVTNLYSGAFTDSTHSFYTVDSEEDQKALQLLYDLEGIIFDPTLTSGDAIKQFCSKETAMCFCWNASVEIQQTINNSDLDFDPFPMAFPTDRGDPELQGGIWGLGVFDNGDEERIQAAKTFIRYIAEDDTMYTRAVLTSFYWPVRDVDGIYENDMLMTEYSIFTPYMGDYYQVTPQWAEARTAWWQMLTKIGDGTEISEAVKDFPSPE